MRLAPYQINAPQLFARFRPYQPSNKVLRIIFRELGEEIPPGNSSLILRERGIAGPPAPMLFKEFYVSIEFADTAQTRRFCRR